MKLKIIKGTNNVGKPLLQIATEKAKIAVSFGEDIATGEIPELVNPMIEGLTCGTPSYDGVFILRNPENCNLIDFIFKEIPIYLEKKLKEEYIICSEFMNFTPKENIKEIMSLHSYNIKDVEIIYYIVDGSNFNTSLILIKAENKKILVSGDFRGFDLKNYKKNLNNIIEEIGNVDYWFIEGKYLGKIGPENAPDNDFFQKSKNIMKFYKQVFIIQSETDLTAAKRFYDVSLKTKKIFIENTFLVNLTTTLVGSAPNPIINKKVYTYNPLMLENKDFEFKKKYVTHFYINNANNKMKRENYTININTNMLQDVQVFFKENVIYDACLILAINKKYIKFNKELEEFINLMKDFDMDYYEIYSVGEINYNLLNGMIKAFEPKRVIPIGCDPDGNVRLENLDNIENLEI